MSRSLRLSFQTRVLLLSVAVCAPALIIVAVLLLEWEIQPLLRWLLFATLCIVNLIICLALRSAIVHPLRSLASVIEALRGGDYSLRGSNERAGDALGDVMIELNSLSRTLYEQRLSALEADVLLEKLIAEMDIAMFAFDAQRKLVRINRTGEQLLGRGADALIGIGAAELGIDVMLEGESGRIVLHAFPNATGRWEIRRRTYRKDGKPHELLVISDLSRALRDEERHAWRRMVRVIGHELNSSLAPIKSIAGTVAKLIDRNPLPEDWRADASGGLGIIQDRAESLRRFMSAYARLARLPSPKRTTAPLAPLVQRAASLYAPQVVIEPGPEVLVEIDQAQVEQVLINLVKNAVEATADCGGVRVRWRVHDQRLILEVEDDGPGLARTESLWVPFFTTKPGGSGIGLALSREIIEGHGGAISLQNRNDARGCLAQIVLPL